MCGVQKLSTARFQFLNKHSWTIDCSIGGSPSWRTNHWVKDVRINESTAWSNKCEKTDTDVTLTRRDFHLFLVTLFMLDSAWMWLVPMKSTHVSNYYKLCARWRSQTDPNAALSTSYMHGWPLTPKLHFGHRFPYRIRSQSLLILII